MKRRDHILLFWTIVFISVSGYWLYRMSPSQSGFEFNEVTRNFYSLYQIYRHQGFKRYLEVKDDLKAQVKKTFEKDLSDEEEIFATNVALYLFPEILPEDNLEKEVALEQWAPLQAAIEQKPKSPESRIWFEEMRASIWNYESPNFNAARISEFANEVLRIYNEISSP